MTSNIQNEQRKEKCSTQAQDCPLGAESDTCRHEAVALLQDLTGVQLYIDVYFKLEDFQNVLGKISLGTLCAPVTGMLHALPGLGLNPFSENLACNAVFTPAHVSVLGLLLHIPFTLGGVHPTYDSVYESAKVYRQRIADSLLKGDFYSTERHFKLLPIIIDNTDSVYTFKWEKLTAAFNVDFELPCLIARIAVGEIGFKRDGTGAYSFEYAGKVSTVNSSDVVFLDGSVFVCWHLIGELLSDHSISRHNDNQQIHPLHNFLSRPELVKWALPAFSLGIYFFNFLICAHFSRYKSIADRAVLHQFGACFLSQLFLSLPNMITTSHTSTVCLYLSLFAHFFWLVSFLWLPGVTYIAYHSAISRQLWTCSPKRHIPMGVVVTYLVPLFLVAVGLILELREQAPLRVKYCRGTCFFGDINGYIFLLAGPAILTMLFNFPMCVRFLVYLRCGRRGNVTAHKCRITVNPSCYKLLSVSMVCSIAGTIGILLVGLSVYTQNEDFCLTAQVCFCLQSLSLAVVSIVYRGDIEKTDSAKQEMNNGTK
ncbi:uncharacterized protein LOC106153825 [Lingula anatina]|uniref:Uncharacterized protein LOC106153825 n=1 Tax=Lingula anatina TaxID=7574 RepID=A0A1S3HBI3_LINAN|nr:uncharacterized protein LOC106153825 [Lingula anatina]|eukprot:XP_013383380.1 uncharacterized protein LOC106153825 [Lingula anatina]